MFKAVVSRPSLFSVVAPVTFAVMTAGFLPQMGAQQAQRIPLQGNSETALSQMLTGGPAELRQQLQSQRSAIAVAVADFDRDGAKDMITGYTGASGYAMTLQRGVMAATAPTGADWTAYTQGYLAAPFSETSELTALPVRPDMMQAVDLNGDGAIDVLVAARGDTSAFLLLGNGKGGFSAASPIAMGGTVTAMTTIRAQDASSYVVASVCSAAGCRLQLVGADSTQISSFSLPAPASSILVAPLNGSGHEDIAVVSGGSVLLFDGAAARQGQTSIDTLPIQNAAAISTGNFVWDRRGFPQMAVVDTNGSLHVLARSGLDPTVITTEYKLAMMPKIAAWKASNYNPSLNPYANLTVLRAGMPWTEVQTMTHVAPAAQAGVPMVLLHGRFSGSGADDLAVASGSAFVKVASISESDGIKRTFRPAVTSMASNASTGNTILSAAVVRISPDAMQGTIVADGRPQAYVTMPTTHPHTYNVNTTADGPPAANCSGTCSLRTAIHLANADAAVTGANGLSAVDIINVPAGTYTLTYNEGTDSAGDLGYRIPVDAGVSIVGAGSASTIIQMTTSTGVPVDKVMSFNEGFVNAPGSFDIFLSGLTLQNGTNHNTNTTGGITNGGIADWDNNGTGNLTFTNCVLSTGTALMDVGGILGTTNFTLSAGSGTLDIESSTITAGKTPAQGGGIFMAQNIPLTLNNSTVSNNLAAHSANPSFANSIGLGGGIELYSATGTPNTLTASQISIANSTISNNTAMGNASGGGYAGGIQANEAFTMSGSTISGNSAPQFGGGITVNLFTGSGASITSSTFTGNTATASGSSGGAIAMQAFTESANVLSVSYSRFHGNTASGNTTSGAVSVTGTDSTTGGTITATNDWWGCNGPASGTSCDTGAAIGTGATFTATPYTTLAVTVPASPTGSAAFTASGSMAQNSVGTAYTGSQDNAYAGLGASLVVTQHDGTATTAPATTLSATDTISESVTPSTALSAPGAGTAKVTVDGYTVTANFTLYEADMAVAVSQTGNVNAGSSATYTISPSNVGNSASSGTVTVADTLPSGFTATSMSGNGWTCTVATATCTTSNTAAGGSSFNAITLTASVVGTDAGSYTNSVTISGGSEIDTGNDTATDTTVVIGAPTISEAFSPTSVAINTNSTVTFTLGNPSANTISLTGVGFTDTLPTGLVVSTPNGAGGTCSGTLTATAGGGSISFSGATIASGTTCTVVVNVKSSSVNSYPNPTGPVAATNGPTGSTATATLAVTAGPATKFVVSGYPTPTTAGTVGTATVTAYDASNNVATGYTGTVHLTSSDAAATLPANYTFGSGDAGVHTFSITLKTQGTQSITVTDTVTASITGSQTGITVNPGAATSLSITAPTSAVAGAAFNVVVTARDAFGNTATSYSGTVQFSSNSTQAQLPANSTLSNGVGTFSAVLNTAGTGKTVTVSDAANSFSATTASIMVSPGNARTLTVTGLGPFTAPGQAGTATVTAKDAYGNTATGYTGTLQITSSDATATLPANYTYVSGDLGVHTFSVAPNTAGTQTVTATDTTTPSITGTETGIVVEDAVWILNANSTVARLDDNGAQLATAGASSGTATLGNVAFDNAGNAWVADNAANTIQLYSAKGVAQSVTGAASANINAPIGVAIDGAGYVWIANGSGSVSVLSSPTTAITTTSAYQAGTGVISGPTGIIIDSSGSVWIANTNNSVTQIIGGAAPVITPTVIGTTNNTLGTKP